MTKDRPASTGDSVGALRDLRVLVAGSNGSSQPRYLDASPTVGLVVSAYSSIGGAIESALSGISSITRLFGELHHTH